MKNNITTPDHRQSASELTATIAEESKVFFDRLDNCGRELVTETVLRSLPPSFATVQRNTIMLKQENEQRTNAFKLRGALNAIWRLSPEQQEAGIVTASAGNHALGVVIAGNANKIGDITVVVPNGTPGIKIEKIKRFGSDNIQIVLEGDNFDEALAFTRKNFSAQTLIHPFDDPNVIAGQGSIAHEILRQEPTVDIIGVAVGGGGLISGVGAVVKQFNEKTGRDVKVVGFEPASVNSMRQALGLDRPKFSHATTIAEGANVRRVGELTRTIVSHLVECGVVTVEAVDEEELKHITVDINHSLLNSAGGKKSTQLIEGAGALPIAGIADYIKSNDLTHKNIVLVASGGNIGQNKIASLHKQGYGSPIERQPHSAYRSLGLSSILCI